jgi:hypothetical protein
VALGSWNRLWTEVGCGGLGSKEVQLKARQVVAWGDFED